MRSQRLQSLLLFCLASFVIRGLYIFLLPKCFSFDMNSWIQVGDLLLAGQNPYQATECLNWPPMWMQLIYLFEQISRTLHVPFYDVVRVFLILVETLVAALLYVAIVRFAREERARRLLILGIALNPISILQVCQHGNFDMLVGFWILLAVYMLLRFQEQHEPQFWLAACFALGLGAATKTIPLCLAPLLLLSARKLKTLEQFLGLAFLLVPVILGLSIIYVLCPGDIHKKVFEYRSTGGTFGFSGLFNYLGLPRLTARWSRVFEITYGLGWMSTGLWLFFKDTLKPQALVSLALVLLIAISALGPGYGMQYICWFLPLLLLQYELSDRPVRIFLLGFYLVTAVVYLIDYAFNSYAYGAFVLVFSQNQSLVDFGARIATKTGEFLLCLPLWLIYLIFVGYFGARIGREMISDFRMLPVTKFRRP
jgi:hypothetical protein